MFETRCKHFIRFSTQDQHIILEIVEANTLFCHFLPKFYLLFKKWRHFWIVKLEFAAISTVKYARYKKPPQKKSRLLFIGPKLRRQLRSTRSNWHFFFWYLNNWFLETACSSPERSQFTMWGQLFVLIMIIPKIISLQALKTNSGLGASIESLRRMSVGMVQWLEHQSPNWKVPQFPQFNSRTVSHR